MNTKFFHKDFLWNGISFTSEKELIEFVKSNYPELTEFIREWFGEKGLIYCSTSGSTGAPKMIGLKREHMINSARATGSYFGLSNNTSALLCLPLGFIAGRMMLIRSMVLGWHLDAVEPAACPKIPKNKEFDFCAMVPVQLYNSVDQLENIDTLIVGGGQVSPALSDKVSGLKTKVYATYGMTETITHVALSPVNIAAGNIDKQAGLFKALPGVSFSLDHRGCLVIKAPKISTEDVVTNDIVDLNSSTEFIWLSRYDHIINSGGLKLLPELIEKKYQDLIKTDFFIHGKKDPVLGERVVLIVEGDRVSDLLKTIQLYQQDHQREVSKYEVPKEVLYLKEFERTKTGKINRSATFKKVNPKG